jgi:ribonuclease VapC
MSENGFVLDASAVLCLFRSEPGVAIIEGLLSRAVIGTVNLAEVVTKLQERGATGEMIDESLADLNTKIIDFDVAIAVNCGKLRNATRSKGLSLGDRACLALAAARGATAVTTDKAWKDFDNIAKIMVVR